MVDAKFQDYGASGSPRRFLMVFTIYWHGGNLGDVTIDEDHFLQIYIPSSLGKAQNKIWF